MHNRRRRSEVQHNARTIARVPLTVPVHVLLARVVLVRAVVHDHRPTPRGVVQALRDAHTHPVPIRVHLPTPNGEQASKQGLGACQCQWHKHVESKDTHDASDDLTGPGVGGGGGARREPYLPYLSTLSGGSVAVWHTTHLQAAAAQSADRAAGFGPYGARAAVVCVHDTIAIGVGEGEAGGGAGGRGGLPAG